jgi:hypothetical protein
LILSTTQKAGLYYNTNFLGNVWPNIIRIVSFKIENETEEKEQRRKRT